MAEKIFYTDRLMLRKISEKEWDNYYKHVTEADEIFVQYGCEPTEELLEYIQEPTPEVIYYSIILKENQKMVGYIGIPEYNSNIEYYIFPEHRRNGYCFEALKSFVELYLDGKITENNFDSVVAEIIMKNEASINMVIKAGFKKQAIGCSFGYKDEKKEEICPQTLMCMYEYSKKEK